MKPLVYISGIGGGVLVILGTLGVLFELQIGTLLLLIGIIFILIFFVLSWIQRKESGRRLDEIIRSHKDQRKSEKEHKPKEVPKGWSMNDSPFRDRKSGLEWNGGNIKGLTATRGNRRKIFGR